MRIGVSLPQFRNDATAGLRAAGAAEELGFDGVFVFDHLWAIGTPERPAIPAFPLLGALAAQTERVALGPLVARIGLVPDAVLVHQLRSLAALSAGRLIAGIGTGDRLSADENLAFGIAYPSAAERRRRLAAVSDQLRAAGIETWVGGRAERTRLVAVDHADALNLWGVEPAIVAAEHRVDVTWGGVVPGSVDECATLLRSLHQAGATWAICAPAYGDAPDPVPALESLAAAVDGWKRTDAGLNGG